GYTRTLRSVFQNVGGGFTLPDSMRFEPDPSLPLEDRVKYLEDKTPNAAFGALGGLFSDLPFGNENTWIAGLSVSQPLFTGGRISSAIGAAEAAADAARALAEEARAEVALEVKRAYYDALLASRSVDIVELSTELAREHLEQVRLRLSAGRAARGGRAGEPDAAARAGEEPARRRDAEPEAADQPAGGRGGRADDGSGRADVGGDGPRRDRAAGAGGGGGPAEPARGAACG